MNGNKFKILVVDNEENICSRLSDLFEANGYRVLTANTGALAQMMFASHLPDLVILDLVLPDNDGMMLLKSIRSDSAAPIIVLSAKSDEKDKVDALDAGANDYVTKPFGSAELLARIRCALRNAHLGENGNQYKRRFVLDNLTICYESRQMFIDETEINLTQTEYNIVVFLAERRGRVMTYSEIIKAIWGFSDSGSVKKLQVNMANIRKKMRTKSASGDFIINELGVGYRMK